MNSCIFKNRLHRRYLRNPTVANERFYKTYRNRLTATIRSAKKRYYVDKLDHHKGNLKSMWREINGILGKPKESTLPASFTMDGDHFVSQSNDISDSFLLLPKKIPSSSTHFSDYLHNFNGFSFFLTPTNAQEILRIGKDTKRGSSCSFDGICSTVMKYVLPFIAEPLAYIFNLSFHSGSVHLNLKVAKIIPVFKNGDKSNINNYRPISILPCFSKLLERLIYNHLSCFISRFHLLFDHQFGFRSKHYTDLALIKLVDSIAQALISNKMYCVGVFIDLFKALTLFSYFQA